MAHVTRTEFNQEIEVLKSEIGDLKAIVSLLSNKAGIVLVDPTEVPTVDPNDPTTVPVFTEVPDTIWGNLNPKLVAVLLENGIASLDQASAMPDEAILALSGVGAVRLKEIRDASTNN